MSPDSIREQFCESGFLQWMNARACGDRTLARPVPAIDSAEVRGFTLLAPRRAGNRRAQVVPAGRIFCVTQGASSDVNKQRTLSKHEATTTWRPRERRTSEGDVNGRAR